MIKVFYGKKGMGKTKQMLENANNIVNGSNGNVVYIDARAICYPVGAPLTISNNEISIGLFFFLNFILFREFVSLGDFFSPTKFMLFWQP